MRVAQKKEKEKRQTRLKKTNVTIVILKTNHSKMRKMNFV